MLLAFGLFGCDSDSGDDDLPAVDDVPVVDDVPPVVTLNGDAVMTVSYQDTFSDPGATATDEHDGALEVTASGQVMSDLGEYTLVYSATDAAGNVGRAERTVRVVDDVPPTITLSGLASVQIERDQPYLEPGAVAEDEIDGTVETTIEGEVGDTAGEYTLVYRATDAAGNTAEASRTVARTPGDYMLEVDVFGEGEVVLAAGMATTPFLCENGRCFGRFQEGERIELEASRAGSGRRFDGWGSGVCDETPSPQRCVLVMDRDRVALPAFVSEAPLTLHDDVVVLTPEQIEGLIFWAPDTGVALFESWTDLDALVPGAVMVSYGVPDQDGFPTEQMFLARVLSVASTPEGSQLVTTLPAGLDDLYASGTVVARADLTPAALGRAKLAPGVSLALAAPRSSASECTFAPADNGPLTEICVRLSASADAQWEESEKRVVLDLDGEAHVTIRSGTLTGRIWLGSVPLPTTAAGVIIVLNLYLKPGVGLEGDFSLPVSGYANVKVGGTYKRRAGPNLDLIFEQSFDTEVGDFEGEITGANVQLGLEAQGLMTVLAALGGEVSVEPYYGASLEPKTADCALLISPYWGVDVQAKVFLRVWKLGVGSKTLIDWGHRSPNLRSSRVPLPCRDMEAPTPPSDLTAELVDGRDVRLQWSMSSDNKAVRSYRVYREGRRIADTSHTTYLHTNPGSGTHCYNVTAKDQAGNSSNSSAEECLTVPREDSASSNPPAKPVVEVTDVTSSSALLNWSEEEGVEYWLWVQLPGGVWHDPRSLASSPLRVLADLNAQGRRTCYRIRAENSAGMDDSAPACFTPVEDNAPPITNAGEDFTVVAGAIGTLTGYAVDQEGRIRRYEWTQIGGPDVSLRDSSRRVAEFTAPAAEAETMLTFQLTVTDDDGATDSDAVGVTVLPTTTPANEPPQAHAGYNDSVTAGDSVTLSGTRSRDDRGIVAYRWEQYRGPTVALSDATSRETMFVAPSVSEETDLRFRLEVTDGDGETDRDTVRVTVLPPAPPPRNRPPVASAGTDQWPAPGATVTLAGSGSDSDGRVDGYAWTQIAGPTVTLSGASSATATFTAPAVTERTTLSFLLTVTDDEGATDSDEVSVWVWPQATNNLPPVADAGTDQTVASGATVTLTGSGSDSDGWVNSYEWTQAAGPTVTLSDAWSATATFTAPTVTAQTTLTFHLTVTDNEGAIGIDEMHVTVLPPGTTLPATNLPPMADARANQTVLAGAVVKLRGSGSDPDGRVASYSWEQTVGPTASLWAASSATAAFAAPAVTARTTLTFRLTVTDDNGATSSDEATVIVDPVGPDTPVNIPDGALRAALYNLIRAKDHREPITVSEMESLSAIFVVEKGVADLTGLEFATNAFEVTLTGNSISDISALGTLTSLEELLLDRNSFSDISVLENLTSLRELGLSSNPISDISTLSALTSPEALNLYSTSISDSDISALEKLPWLSSLTLADNSISDISPLGRLSEIRSCWLYDAYVPCLRTLNLSVNSISDISHLGGFTRLVNVYLDNNSVSDISAITALTELNFLRLNNNSISDAEPLVDSVGITATDYVEITRNPLNRDSVTLHIPALRARGVSVACSLVDGTSC